MERQSLLKQFPNQEERLLFAQVLDQAMECRKKHEMVFTDFIDAGKSGHFLEVLQRNFDLEIKAFGGSLESERRIIGFAPSYLELTYGDFRLKTLSISKNKKFGQDDLSHRDYLGSILGLGIDRKKVGDILLLEETTYCFVKEEIAGYLCGNLKKVAKTPVQVEVVEALDKTSFLQKGEERRFTVASVRLDAVLSAGFHLSRGKVQEILKSEKVFLNWNVAESASVLLKEGDMISMRGFGRARLLEICGETKKGRVAVVMELFL